jgi:elongation factor P
MINVNDFKTGVTIELDKGIFQVMQFQHVKPGKGPAFVRSKLRNLRTGAVIDHTFNAGIKVKKAHIEKKTMQYLYESAGDYFFMDNDTYDQFSMPEERLEHERKFLVDGMEIEMVTFKGEIVGVQLPEKVVLTVAEAAPGVKGNTASSATKDAVLETGHTIRVPLFINQDERVIVSTSDGKYVSREK